MYSQLKNSVYKANMDLLKHGLVIFTFGNVSGYDPEKEVIAIKPSGVKYEQLQVEDIVIVSLNGKIVEGNMNPSSDTPTHIELYKSFPDIRGVVHTHSEWATGWAQAGKAIPAFGTTHADYFYGEVPCTRELTEAEVNSEYELNTGKVIAALFEKLDPYAVPSVLVKGHGPFSWGLSPEDAVHNAVVLEYVSKMAYMNIVLGNDEPIQQYLLDKHYLRKHGKSAYYGQGRKG